MLEGQAAEVVVDLPPPAIIAMVYGAFLGLIRAESEGYITLDDAFIDRTFEHMWASIRR